MNFLTIDPGFSGTGWAFINGKTLTNWGILRSNKGDLKERAYDLKEKLRLVRLTHPLHTMYIEWPSFQGMIAQNTNSIIKLAYLIGVICTPNTVFIPVSSWRGNCPKEVLWKRAEKFFHKKGFGSHAGDAVAIAHWILTERKDVPFK